MAQQNLAELRIDQAWVDQFNGHLVAALTMLEAKGVSLTPAERSSYPTIGLNNAEMVNTGVRLVDANPNWFPSDYDRPEVLVDASDRSVLLQASPKVSKLAELFSDTLHAIGSDLLTGVYAASPYIIQGGKLTGEGNNQVAEFRKYFKRNRPKAAPEPQSPTA